MWKPSTIKQLLKWVYYVLSQLTTFLYRKQLGNVPCRLANGVFREPLKTVMVNITV